MAGLQRMATVVEAELGRSPADGTLWRFTGGDRRKAKMLRYDSDVWCLLYVRLAEGSIRWERDSAVSPTVAFDRGRLVCLLAGRPVEYLCAKLPVQARWFALAVAQWFAPTTAGVRGWSLALLAHGSLAHVHVSHLDVYHG